MDCRCAPAVPEEPNDGVVADAVFLQLEERKPSKATVATEATTATPPCSVGRLSPATSMDLPDVEPPAAPEAKQPAALETPKAAAETPSTVDTSATEEQQREEKAERNRARAQKHKEKVEAEERFKKLQGPPPYKRKVALPACGLCIVAAAVIFFTTKDGGGSNGHVGCGKVSSSVNCQTATEVMSGTVTLQMPAVSLEVMVEHSAAAATALARGLSAQLGVEAEKIALTETAPNLLPAGVDKVWGVSADADAEVQRSSRGTRLRRLSEPLVGLDVSYEATVPSGTRSRTVSVALYAQAVRAELVAQGLCVEMWAVATCESIGADVTQPSG